MAEERRGSAARSAWSKLPITPSGEASPLGARPDDGEGSTRASARALAEDVGSAIRKGIAPVTSRVGAAVRSGMETVEDALDDPSKASVGELIRQADLPELEGDDPLASIGLRLDREADLWRGLAMRQLARAAWMDRLSVVSSVVVLIGEVVLAAIAAFRAMFASGGAGHVAVLLGAGALLLVIGTVTIASVCGRLRRSQLEVARDALLRADLAEARLHRLAALMAVRVADREGYLESLRAFEGDLRRG